MKEIVLRQFFEEHATDAELARDLEGTRVVEGPPGFHSPANYRIESRAGTFEVAPARIARIVEAVIARELSRGPGRPGDPLETGTL